MIIRSYVAKLSRSDVTTNRRDSADMILQYIETVTGGTSIFHTYIEIIPK